MSKRVEVGGGGWGGGGGRGGWGGGGAGSYRELQDSGPDVSQLQPRARGVGRGVPVHSGSDMCTSMSQAETGG